MRAWPCMDGQQGPACMCMCMYMFHVHVHVSCACACACTCFMLHVKCAYACARVRGPAWMGSAPLEHLLDKDPKSFDIPRDLVQAVRRTFRYLPN